MIYLSLLLQQLIASGTHVIGKSLTDNVAPSVALLFRAGLVSLAYITIILIGRKRFKMPTKSEWGTIALLGLLNIPVNQFLFLTSLKLTTPPNVALAYAMTPVFVLLIAIFFLKEKITLLKSAGVVLSIIGAFVIISARGLNLSGDGFQGDMIAFAASFSWALYTIIGKRPSQRLGAFLVTGLGMALGFIMYLPIFAFLPAEVDFAAITPTNWGQIAYLAFMTSGVAYALWYHALTKLEASKVSVFNNLQPVLTTVLSIIFLGFALEQDFVIGASLIVIGVIITQKG
jgi:drug/metabolite transporter (DMT)-like permease